MPGKDLPRKKGRMIKKGVFRLEKDKYIGQIYGGYKIISVADERANDGHKIYNCQCVHCGIIKQKQLSTLKYRKDNKCYHQVQIGSVKIPNVIEDNSIPMSLK